MLSSNSFESFRAYTLGTVARLYEALELVDDVQQARLPRPTLNPVLAELGWSLVKDPVAQALAPAEISAFTELMTSSFDLQSLLAHIRLLVKAIEPGYQEALEDRLSHLFECENRRVLFRQISGFYCSHLVNVGYSKPHIARQVEQHFSEVEPTQLGAGVLRRFFDLFDGEKRSFVVQTLVSEDFGRYMASLGFIIRNLSEIPKDAAAVLLSNTTALESSLVLEREIEGLDAYGAMVRLQEELATLRAITYLDPSGLGCQWGETMYVMRAGIPAGERQERNNIGPLSPPRRPISGRRLKRIRRNTERLLDNFDAHSTERLFGSINTAALARTASNVGNQLISLWSAVEILLREPPRETVRIVHYADLLVPCIALRHLRRLFVAVFDEMIVSYRRAFSALVSEVPGEVDQHTKFIQLLALACHGDLRQRLCSLCVDNPLALHRLWKLHGDTKTPASVLAALRGHRERLEWQVHRIYRARNALVHAGKVPSYLDSLVANLGEYYGAAVATIVRRASTEEESSDIDQIVAELGIQYRIFTRHFERQKKEAQMTEDDVRVLSALSL
jgi:hypothetical protein